MLNSLFGNFSFLLPDNPAQTFIISKLIECLLVDIFDGVEALVGGFKKFVLELRSSVDGRLSLGFF